MWGSGRLHCFLQEKMGCLMKRAGRLVLLTWIRQKKRLRGFRLLCNEDEHTCWRFAWPSAHVATSAYCVRHSFFVLPCGKHLRNLETEAMQWHLLPWHCHSTKSCRAHSCLLAVWKCHSLPKQLSGMGRAWQFIPETGVKLPVLCILLRLTEQLCGVQGLAPTQWAWLHRDHTWWKIPSTFPGKQQEALL